MANRKNPPRYEGRQYRGGRQQGRKNLQRTASGHLKNQYGVTFTDAERKALESSVNRANYRRKKMLEEAAKLPRKVAGRDTGDTVGSLQLMGRESDFILARKSKSLQRFRTREQFDTYMKNLERVLSPDYLDDRIRLYKRNYMQALTNAFGDDAKGVVMKVRMMKPADFMKMVEQDELLEISYVYDPGARGAKLNRIRQSMGMKPVEEFDDELPY